MMRRKIGLLLAAAVFFLCLAVGCTLAGEDAAAVSDWAGMQPISSMPLTYAQQFAVDDYEGGCALVTIAGTDRFLVVPQGGSVPEGLEEGITVLQQPLENLYLAASSGMDPVCQLDALDQIRLTSTTSENWSIPRVRQALEEGSLLYAGKYSAPDYELVLAQGCDLAVESTMIYHSPEVAEQLQSLGIPVLVERSSYEPHPLGRLEWIKLYGLLLGKEEEAAAFFDSRVQQLEEILTGESTGKTVAFFYISSNGYANVRKPGDYVSKMIELAGGVYIFSDLDAEDNALSTMNMQMEAFYAGARDADYLIYNSTIDGELQTLDQLLEKSPLLADFRAVKTGNVWCTEKNMFQQMTGIGDMIADFHAIVTGEADDKTALTYLHRLT